MKQLFQAAVVAAAVLAVPALSLAAQTAKTAAPAASKPAIKAASAAVHSARGVVKSMDASSLVLTERSKKKAKAHDVHFVLDPATQKEGTIAVGSAVQITYRDDAKQHVATAIRAGSAKKS